MVAKTGWVGVRAPQRLTEGIFQKYQNVSGLVAVFFLQSILMFLDCIHTLVQHSQYHNTPIIHIQNSISFRAHGWWTPSFICIEGVYGLTVTLAQWHRCLSWTPHQVLELSKEEKPRGTERQWLAAPQGVMAAAQIT